MDGALYVIDKVNYLIRFKDDIITPTPIMDILEECPHVIEVFVMSTYNLDKCIISTFLNTTRKFKVSSIYIYIYIHIHITL